MRAFWEVKTLAELTHEEWEALCDGCARCCLVKLEDEDSGAVHYTDVACRLLDLENCRCRDYPQRTERVADCVRLTPENLDAVTWMPRSCAYRRLAEGRGLAWWHPLVSGRSQTVSAAGISVAGQVIDETEVAEEDLVAHIVGWID